MLAYIFQSTLLQEERPASQFQYLRAYSISIHAPTRGATLRLTNMRCRSQYFNPRSYKRSDWHSSYICMYPIISIHAPTRGATDMQQEALAKYKISIHAPTRGATRLFMSKFCKMLNFNPRSYKRSDSYPLLRSGKHPNFNPRSYKRSDLARLCINKFY